MAIIVKESGGGHSAPLEAGTYPARCVGVIDLGIQHNDFNDKDQEKVRLIFELPTKRNDEGKPRWLSKAYTASLHEKATLRQHLDAWRGKPFTEEDLKGFSLEKVLGAPCLVTTKTNEKGYANIANVAAVVEGMEVAPLENDKLLFNLDDPATFPVLERLPEWMRKEVEQSPTWRQIRRENGDGGDLDECGEKLPF